MDEKKKARFPLSALSAGQTAVIIAISVSGALRHRLVVMGLAAGTVVSIC